MSLLFNCHRADKIQIYDLSGSRCYDVTGLSLSPCPPKGARVYIYNFDNLNFIIPGIIKIMFSISLSLICNVVILIFFRNLSWNQLYACCELIFANLFYSQK